MLGLLLLVMLCCYCRVSIKAKARSDMLANNQMASSPAAAANTAAAAGPSSSSSEADMQKRLSEARQDTWAEENDENQELRSSLAEGSVMHTEEYNARHKDRPRRESAILTNREARKAQELAAAAAAADATAAPAAAAAVPAVAEDPAVAAAVAAGQVPSNLSPDKRAEWLARHGGATEAELEATKKLGSAKELPVPYPAGRPSASEQGSHPAPTVVRV